MPQGYIITCTLLTGDIHFCRFLFVCFDFMLWFQIIPRTTHRQPSVDADTPVVVKGPCEIDLYTDVLRIMKNSSVLIGGVLDDSSSSCLSSRVGWSCHLHQTWQTCLILDIDNVAIHCMYTLKVLVLRTSTPAMQCQVHAYRVVMITGEPAAAAAGCKSHRGRCSVTVEPRPCPLKPALGQGEEKWKISVDYILVFFFLSKSRVILTENYV